MKALALMEYGEPQDLAIIEVPIPIAGPGQIQVRIEAVTINATDLRVITGQYNDMLPVEFPYIPGNDFAGTVTAVGPGVSAYTVGDEVFGQALPRQLRSVVSSDRPSLSTGALAEYAVFEADTLLIAHRPGNVPPEQAAALAIGGMTARAVMKIAQPKQGESALVIGATGASGSTLLPMLARAGVRTYATARTPEGRDLVSRLGAEDAVGVDPEGYPAEVDVVFNFALFQDQIHHAACALRTGGRLVSIIFPPATAEDLGRDDVEFHFMLDMDGIYGGMPDVAAEAGSRSLTAQIAQTLPFAQAVDAVVSYATTKPLGNIVVRF